MIFVVEKIMTVTLYSSVRTVSLQVSDYVTLIIIIIVVVIITCSSQSLLNRLCRVRCYSFDPYVVSIGAVRGLPIATVIVHRVVLDDYCVLTS